MQTITFYSYKGGLGRTLAVANVARYLSLFGKNVLAVDFDLEAPGLHYKLSLGGEGQREIERGLVDYIHAFLLDQEPETLRSYVVEMEAKTQTRGSIHLLPAGAVPSADYWQKLARINWHDLFYSENAKGVPFFLELKARIAEEIAPDYLLIDARTGITEVGGVATTLLADTVVCLLLNNRENLEGAREVLRSVQRAPRLPGQAAVKMMPVVARLPELEDPSQEERIVEEVRMFLNEEAPELASTLSVEEVLVLHVDPDLQLRESLRVGGAKSPEESTLLRDYLRLFTQLIPQEVFRTYLGPLILRNVASAWRKADLETIVPAAVFREIRDILKLEVIRSDYKYRITFKERDPEIPAGYVTIRRELGYKVRNLLPRSAEFEVRSDHPGEGRHLNLLIRNEEVAIEEGRNLFFGDGRALLTQPVILAPQEETEIFLVGEAPYRLDIERKSYRPGAPVIGIDVEIVNQIPDEIELITVSMNHPAASEMVHDESGHYVLKRAFLPGQGFEVRWRQVRRSALLTHRSPPTPA